MRHDHSVSDNDGEIKVSALPVGVLHRRLTMNVDDRGVFTEIFRCSWNTRIEPVQWNAVTSAATVFRGAHVHIRHDDYLILLRGHATIGLRDLREGSPSEGQVDVVEVTGDDLCSITIPPGVLHGFYFHEPSTHIYSVSEYWNDADELGCHWQDPELGVPWPVQEALLSERDATAPPFRSLIEQLEPYQPIAVEPL